MGVNVCVCEIEREREGGGERERERESVFVQCREVIRFLLSFAGAPTAALLARYGPPLEADRDLCMCMRVEFICSGKLYCAQKETHIFNVAIGNELFD